MNRESKKRQMLARIDEQGGIEVVLHRIAEGETLTAVAGGFGVSRHVLGAFLYRDPELHEALVEARETASWALAEEALEIAGHATDATVDSDRLKVYARRWLAAKYHPRVFGKRARVTTTEVGTPDLGLHSPMGAAEW
jgi:hypothetical protein